MSSGMVSSMPPPARRSGQKRQREQTLLEEDEYTDRVEAIIQRDFFPDLPKLQNKLEWLQAVKSGDPSQLQQAQLNIAQRRAGIRTPVGATPGGFGTPGASLLRTPGLGLTPAATPSMAPTMTIQTDGPKDPTLDKFFAQHTSEDNASFQELMKLSQERLRRAKPWLFKDHNPPKASDAPLALTDAASQQLPKQPAALPAPEASSEAASSASAEAPAGSASTALQVAAPANDGAVVIKDADRAVQRPKAPTDGYGTTGQESQTLDSWPHVNKSALYYDSSQRDVVPWTANELADMVQGPPKQIKHSATRFPSDFEAGPQTSKAGAGTSGAPTQGPQQLVRGYGVVNTPAFTPGPEQSPLMTWGDIGSTPVRLDQEDDIHVSTSTGPAFKMAAVPARDQIGRGIAQKATLSLKRKAAARAGTPLTSGLPTGLGLSTGKRRAPGTPLPLSSAGKRLASNLRGGTPASDAQLRASYKPLPSGRPGSTRMGSVQPSPALGDGFSTPLVHQPNTAPKHSNAMLEQVRAQALAAHAAHSKADVKATADLTDDLLNI